MTKEEYRKTELQRSWDVQSDFAFELGGRYSDNDKTLYTCGFNSGFEAGCKYYREHILELKDNDSKE